MSKIDELHDLLSDNITKVGELLKKEEQVEKGKNKTLWIFAVVGVIVFVAAAAYGLYRFFAPDYLEDFEDDFDDDFEDDFFEDEDEKSEESDSDEEAAEDKEKKDEEDDKDAVTDEMTEDEV